MVARPASTATPSNFVSTAWLQERLGGAVQVIDGSWHMPATGRSPAKEFEERRIPGAVRFDVDAIADRSTDLPHMFPSDDDFARAMQALGISKSRPAVVYDTVGLFSAARVWYTLKVFGHPDVRVLTGGLPRWVAEDRPLESGPVVPRSPASFAPLECWSIDARRVRSIDEMVAIANLSLPRAPTETIVVDARSRARFEGTATEPRPIPSGHMRGARSVPFDSILETPALPTPSSSSLPSSSSSTSSSTSSSSSTSTSTVSAGTQLKPLAEVVRVFADAGIDVKRPGEIVASCGSGVTASVLLLALHEAGRPWTSEAIYDGSWSEWGARAPALFKDPTQAILTGPSD